MSGKKYTKTTLNVTPETRIGPSLIASASCSAASQEVRNTPFCRLHEKFHSNLVRKLSNKLENRTIEFLVQCIMMFIFPLPSGAA